MEKKEKIRSDGKTNFVKIKSNLKLPMKFNFKFFVDSHLVS